MNTKAKHGSKFMSRPCGPRPPSNDRTLATSQRAGVDSATETDRAVPSRDRNRGGSPDSFSAPLRGSDDVRRISPRRERNTDSPLWRSRDHTAAPLWPEEDFRSDAGGIELERAQPAARAALVQPSLRPEDDRDRAAPGRLRQAALARKAALPGAD